MPENYDHYITKNIKALYKRRLFSPIVYLIIVIVLWHVFSLTDLLFPVQLTDDVPLESAYRNDAANMHTTLTAFSDCQIRRDPGSMERVPGRK